MARFRGHERYGRFIANNTRVEAKWAIPEWTKQRKKFQRGWMGLQFPRWFLRKPKVLSGALRPMTARGRQSLVDTRTECGDGGIA
jgi:hypothetical protein